jgi:hypothetical protein
MPRTRKNMKGGFLDSLSSTLSSWGSSISQSASDAYNKAKNATTSAYNSTTSSTSVPVSQSYTPMTTSTYGGKKRSRKMRGGYSNNIALTGLAANASPISGIKTAEPHNWVGGKRTRKNKRGTRKR